MPTSLTKVLITGATGNVGIAVLKALQKSTHLLHIIAGVRDIKSDSKLLAEFGVDYVQFDFTDTLTYKSALQNCEILFLLRPPQITDIQNYFKPLIKAAKDNHVKHIIFLSVQGVERSRFIPHHKIETLITASGIPYTFLRPAYFMQNFSTTLRQELIKNKRIYLPAGNAKFTLVDVTDIGNVTAKILEDISLHHNKAYELTSRIKLSFKEMAQELSRGLGINIAYQSAGLFSFYFAKRKEKLTPSFILVLIMLHYLPRFQKEPAVTDCIKVITGIEPLEFEQFISHNKSILM